MPMKFEPTRKILVDRKSKRYKTVHSYMHTTSTDKVMEAYESDKTKPSSIYSIHGIPILLKDNINFSNLPTTAGASIFKDNYTGNSKVVNKLKENGALILGKTNLSEWAYYFCSGCPLGYSAIGGQTLNPYGRKKFESGGSSSGSGAAIAANLAGKAINISKTTAPHAVSYPFTSLFNVSHGLSLFLSFKKFFKFNYENKDKSETSFDLKKRFDLIFNLFDVQGINDFNL